MNSLRFGLRGPDLETAAVGAFAVDFATSVEASFTVDADAVDRVRDQVMAAFASGAATVADRGVRRPSRRLTVAGLAAGASLMAIAAVVNQADTGGLLYPTRLGIESAVVPPADSPDGWSIRMHRLQERMHDTIVSARDGEAAAVGMALAEYRIELARLRAAIAADPSRQDELIAAISADLGLVEILGRTYHLEAAALLIADMRAVIGSDVPPGGAAPEAPPAVGGPPGEVPPVDPGAGGPPSNSNAGGNGNANGPTTNSAGGNGNANANAADSHAGGNGNANGNGGAAGGSAPSGTAAPDATAAPDPVVEPDPTPTPAPGNAGGNANGNGNSNAGGNGNGNGNAGGNDNANAGGNGNGNANGQADKSPKP